MTNNELIAELSALDVSIRKIERDIGMSYGNLHKYFKAPSRLPAKWVDKLTTYIRLKKDAHLTDWGKVAIENEELKAKIRSLEEEVLALKVEKDQLMPAAKSWNELMQHHEKTITKRNG